MWFCRSAFPSSCGFCTEKAEDVSLVSTNKYFWCKPTRNIEKRLEYWLQFSREFQSSNCILKPSSNNKKFWRTICPRKSYSFLQPQLPLSNRTIHKIIFLLQKDDFDKRKGYGSFSINHREILDSIGKIYIPPSIPCDSFQPCL